jgi:Flp pilus assembly protein TadG
VKRQYAFAAFRRACASFRRDVRGNTALLFSFAIIPLGIGAGAAVDYSRSMSATAKLRAATDAAALAAAIVTQDAMGTRVGLTEERIRTATAAFNANIGQTTTLGTLSFTLTDMGITVRADSSAQFTNAFGGLLKRPTSTLNATAEAGLATNANYEVAFALDNTGSMADSSKMTTLKTAMSRFLNKLETANRAIGNVKVSIVPFGNMIRLDTTTAAGALWIKQPLRDLSYWPGCIGDRISPAYDAKATVPSTGTPETLFEAIDGTYNVFPVTPSSTSVVPALSFTPTACNMAQVMPLTDNFPTMRATITAMTPGGTTNLTIGMAWALQTLTPGDPFNNALPFGGSYTKIIVLLTDGLNTQSRWSTDTPTMNARTLSACAEAKSKGVIVYTIGLMSEDAALLTSCASAPNKHFFAPTPAQIPDIFDVISMDITTVRLSR